MKREKPFIGGKSFKSKLNLKEYAQKLIKDKGICIIDINDKDFLFFKELFLRREYNKKFENYIKLFKILPNPKKPSEINHMVYVTTYDKEYNFSWNKCCDGKGDDSFKEQLNEALRYSIEEQTKECWDKNDKCYNCCQPKIIGVEVDHYNIDFSEIVKNFLKNYNGKIPEFFDKDEKTCQYKFKKEDNAFEEDFQQYHKEKADLKLLCKSCHKKKTYKTLL